MTDNDLRVKVAELCGWERGPKKEIKCGLWFPVMSCWHKKCDKDNWQDEPPNFPHDLNACHEMEEALTSQQLYDYSESLWYECAGFVEAVRATARQRCEAFVKAMEEAK